MKIAGTFFSPKFLTYIVKIYKYEITTILYNVLLLIYQYRIYFSYMKSIASTFKTLVVKYLKIFNVKYTHYHMLNYKYVTL